VLRATAAGWRGGSKYLSALTVRGSFGPELVETLSNRLGIPKNMMFMGTPGGKFPHEIESLGGVRVII
jgi:hypothetical protein